jgi:thiol:disulfide interchange protein
MLHNVVFLLVSFAHQNTAMLKKFLSITLLLVSFFAQAQVLKPVKWDFSVKEISETEAELILKASIEKGWHLYSQDIPPDGPIPTTFKFNANKDFELSGKVAEPKPIEEFDNMFGMTIKYFASSVSFKQKIKIKSKGEFTATGEVEFMVCDDEKCLPPEVVEFSLVVNKGKTGSLTPNPSPEERGAETQTGALQIDTVNKVDSAAITTVQKPDDGKCHPKTFKGASVETKDEFSYWGFMLLAFLAGLAALLTPCVFPMIPMTVTFFLKTAETRSVAIRNGVLYGLSIIGIYTLAGTLVSVLIGPEFANWLSTHWFPNILFFLIFMVFAASFLGMFEITLPSSWVNAMDAKADKGGIAGLLFMAFTLVLVSFSCTGPIVGGILVESARGEFFKPMLGMFAFSLAFALPFSLFAIFPNWLSNLPKSGGWLNSVKVTLGFLELALGLKFLSIADQTYHWGILDREVNIALWIVIFTLLGLYFLGKIKTPHDSPLPYVSVPRIMLAVATFAFVIYLIPGMFGAPLKALSGYLPPKATMDFDLSTPHPNPPRKGGLANAQADDGNLRDGQVSPCGGDLEGVLYADLLHLPHGLNGYFDYEQGMACAKELGKPVFIDFTGHGCVNCREMEANVWSDPAVLKMLREDFVVIALYVDDKTELPEKDWYVSNYDGKKKKTIGAQNADFQICSFDNNAQPYYITLDHQGEMLHAPTAYNLDVSDFVKFLNDAKAEFRKGQQ